MKRYRLKQYEFNGKYYYKLQFQTFLFFWMDSCAKPLENLEEAKEKLTNMNKELIQSKIKYIYQEDIQ